MVRQQDDLLLPAIRPSRRREQKPRTLKSPVALRPLFVPTILPVYRFDSIRILFPRGEIPQNAGNALGISTRRMSVCELLVCRIAANPAAESPPGSPNRPRSREAAAARRRRRRRRTTATPASRRHVSHYVCRMTLLRAIQRCACHMKKTLRDKSCSITCYTRS